MAACSASVAAMGVARGMPLAEATALTGNAPTRQASQRRPARRQIRQSPNRRGRQRAAAASPAEHVHLEEHNPPADRAALLRLARWCERFSPTVELEESDEPESLLLDITGCSRLFHGESALAEQAARQLCQRGLTARLAVADTISGAWAMAHYAPPRDTALDEPHPNGKPPRPVLVAPGKIAAALGPLPLEALRLSDNAIAWLRELGIERIDQLERLPRDHLPERFGPEINRRLDQAWGQQAEVPLSNRPPVPIQLDWSFEPPTSRREVLEAALAQMIEQLTGLLRDRRQGVVQLRCRLELAGGKPIDLPIGLFRATAAAGHLQDLVRLHLEWLALSRPVAAAHLRITETATLEYRQQEIFSGRTVRHETRQVAQLLDRLSGRLGRQSVLRPRLIPDAQPERACRYEPLLATSGNRPGGRRRDRRDRSSADEAQSVWCERPLRLRARPAPVDVWSVVPDGPVIRFRWSGREWRVMRTWGPERIETGWWRGPPVGRDYYRVETEGGGRFWLFRRILDDRWFLHGWFD